MLQAMAEKNTEKIGGLSLRLAKAKDVNILSRLAETTFRETYQAFNTPEDMTKYVQTHFTQEILLAEILHPLVRCFLSFYNGEPVGYCMLDGRRTTPEAGEKNTLEISRIYVLKKFQGNKIGKSLLNACVDFAKENHNKIIWLGVWKKNENAIQFYLHQGFTIAGTTIFVLGNDKQEDHIMIKKLAD